MPIKYQLKPGMESFEIMAGEDEGKKFVRGRAYTDLPAGYVDRFEEIPPQSPLLKRGEAGGKSKTDHPKRRPLGDKTPSKKKEAARLPETAASGADDNSEKNSPEAED